MKSIEREFSAGGVVFKKYQIPNTKYQILFLLGKHSGYHKWVLPKGLIEAGEKLADTAIRETEEEMGVKAKVIQKEPIHIEKYVYYADYKEATESTKHEAPNSKQIQNSKITNTKQEEIEMAKRDQETRRVEKYQEEGGGKTKVFKTVTFYLMEYISGDPKEHGWEMKEVGWFTKDEALKIMGFTGEKEALKKALQLLK